MPSSSIRLHYGHSVQSLQLDTHLRVCLWQSYACDPKHVTLWHNPDWLQRDIAIIHNNTTLCIQQLQCATRGLVACSPRAARCVKMKRSLSLLLLFVLLLLLSLSLRGGQARQRFLHLYNGHSASQRASRPHTGCTLARLNLAACI
eukprot:8226273-Pyramimonas_sp.AAC.1